MNNGHVKSVFSFQSDGN